jgi:hypothetical protein
MSDGLRNLLNVDLNRYLFESQWKVMTINSSNLDRRSQSSKTLEIPYDPTLLILQCRVCIESWKQCRRESQKDRLRRIRYPKHVQRRQIHLRLERIEIASKS